MAENLGRDDIGPDELAFRAAIIARPDDDTPRLAFADWLQDRGQDEYAEFIRCQCELESLLIPHDKFEMGVPRVFVKGADESHDGIARHVRASDLDRYHALREREEALFGKPSDVCRRCDWHRPIPHGNWSWKFRRGFLHEVTCPAAAWLEHGDAITRLHPVRAVRLTTRPELLINDCQMVRLTQCVLLGGPHREPPVVYSIDVRAIQDSRLDYYRIAAEWLLKETWPGITFEWPPPTTWHTYTHQFNAIPEDVMRELMRDAMRRTRPLT